MTAIVGLTTKRVDLSKYRGVDVKSVTLRVMRGADIINAATRCIDPNSGKPLEGAQFGMNFRQQQVAAAIVKVDDQPVIGSVCIAYFDWSARTHAFIGKAFDFLNGTTDKEDDDFLASLAAPDAESPPTSSTV